MSYLKPLYILTAVTLISCTHKGDGPADQGGQGGGGGTTTKEEDRRDGDGGHSQLSSPDQVRRTLKQALRLASYQEVNYNVFVAFGLSFTEVPQGIVFRRVFPKFNTVDFPQRSHAMQEYESPGILALTTNLIEIKETGDCGKRKDNHADASVSTFNLTGQLCFSIANLTRIPPHSLLKELLALILHEVAHLSGAKEDEAKLWQSAFLRYYAIRFETDWQWLETGYQVPVYQAEKLVKEAIEIHRTRPNDPRVYAFMGRFTQILQSMPFITEPQNIELSLNLTRPWLLRNFLNSVYNLINIGIVSFRLVPAMQRENDKIAYPPPLPIGAQLAKILDDLAIRTRQVINNFLTVWASGSVTPMTCLQPFDGIDPAQVKAVFGELPAPAQPCDLDEPFKDPKNWLEQ